MRAARGRIRRRAIIIIIRTRITRPRPDRRTAGRIIRIRIRHIHRAAARIMRIDDSGVRAVAGGDDAGQAPRRALHRAALGSFLDEAVDGGLPQPHLVLAFTAQGEEF